MLNYTHDIAPLEFDGITDANIAQYLAASPLTVRPIPKAELRRWLAETGLLRFGISGPAGWLTLLYDDDRPDLLQVLDWLSDALQNPAIEQIRTEQSAAIAIALERLQAAYTDPDAPGGRPLSIAAMDAQLHQWTGGRKFADVTAEQIADLRSRHQRDAAVSTFVNDVYGAIGLALEPADHTVDSVRQAVSAILNPEGD